MNNIKIKTKVGSLLNVIPYSIVPGVGAIYMKSKNDISYYENSTLEERQRYIFKRMYEIVQYAIDNIPFYKKLYKEKDFSLKSLKCFDDINKIPIVTKKDLMGTSLDLRSRKVKMCYIANTGGSTGVPLSFYKTRTQQIKEMAYYHNAWSRFGYCKSDIRLQFVGRADSRELDYDITRNRLMANIYMPFDKMLDDLSKIGSRVRYLQGYPSVLYDFVSFLENNQDLFIKSGLKDNIKGVFLNSEYPYPIFRKKIGDILKCNTLASYGHTEGCILAFDFGNNIYEVNQSYGYAEAKVINGEMHLIGTSYDNFSSPFIRYDSGDVIDNAIVENDILKSFKMTDGGRSGQYIYDKNGKRISLTGLIFGKHHALFNYCSQIQVAQSDKGRAIIYYVANKDSFVGKPAKELFDSNDIDIDFDFIRIDEPIRTKTGKVLLLIPAQNK
jgi:phenylacetate-CoA ligase